jgi:hypothetical protein
MKTKMVLFASGSLNSFKYLICAEEKRMAKEEGIPGSQNRCTRSYHISGLKITQLSPSKPHTMAIVLSPREEFPEGVLET